MLMSVVLAPERFATQLAFNGFDIRASLTAECARYGMRPRSTPAFLVDAVLWSTEDELLRLRELEGRAAVNATIVFETAQTFASGAPRASRWEIVRETLGDASRIHHVVLRPYPGDEPRPSFFREGWARNQVSKVCAVGCALFTRLRCGTRFGRFSRGEGASMKRCCSSSATSTRCRAAIC